MSTQSYWRFIVLPESLFQFSEGSINSLLNTFTHYNPRVFKVREDNKEVQLIFDRLVKKIIVQQVLNKSPLATEVEVRGIFSGGSDTTAAVSSSTAKGPVYEQDSQLWEAAEDFAKYSDKLEETASLKALLQRGMCAQK